MAAGLVLPTGHGEYPSDLRDYFEQDGKWAVVALIARAVVTVGANVVVMGGNLLSPIHGLILGQILAALLFLVAKTRRLRVLATILYGVMLSATLLAATPYAH